MLGLILGIACNTQVILEGFDSEKWQADAYGCNGQRATLTDEILNRKAELIKLGQNEIVEVLGKPDRHELYSRNKKAFVYYIEGGSDCNQPKEKPDKLVIRFDGIGRAKEIILYKN